MKPKPIVKYSRVNFSGVPTISGNISGKEKPYFDWDATVSQEHVEKVGETKIIFSVNTE